MDQTLHVHLVLRSRDIPQTLEATFSNVTASGNIGTRWQGRVVGIPNNAAETSYRNAGKKGCDPAKFRYSWPVNAGRSRAMAAAAIVIPA